MSNALLLRGNTLAPSVCRQGTSPRGPNCRIVQLRKTLLPQADDPYTWPRFGGAILSGQAVSESQASRIALLGRRDAFRRPPLPDDGTLSKK
jgi:hypothetical protein